jgi:hypothetical protein
MPPLDWLATPTVAPRARADHAAELSMAEVGVKAADVLKGLASFIACLDYGILLT